MAYSPFVATKPVGTDTGPSVITSINVNELALWDAAIMGNVSGFAFSVLGGSAAQPGAFYFKNGTRWLRATLTWVSGNITQIVWELSVNSGGVYSAVCTQVLTYDVSGNLTATTNASGLTCWLLSLMGKIASNAANFAAVAATVAGLGSMSVQAASAVAITGGNATLTTEREVKVAIGSISGSTALDWSTGGLFTVTVTASGATFTHANLPTAKVGFVTLDITNGGLATNLFAGCANAGGVAPALSSSGRDIVSLMCHDGATVSVVGVLKGMA